jgi:acetate kinase
LIDRATCGRIGHRVVHGGVRYAAPVGRRASFGRAGNFDTVGALPAQHNLSPISAIAEQAPLLPQIACFDTSFHRTQGNLPQLFALPRKYTEAGIRRYGFHGLSYEYVVSRLGELAPELLEARLIIAHLGNGASLCAVHRGRSVANTMGFTALDGLMMGTLWHDRSGVLIYLMDAYGMDTRAIESCLSPVRPAGRVRHIIRHADIAGIIRSGGGRAIALFNYRIVREIGLSPRP